MKTLFLILACLTFTAHADERDDELRLQEKRVRDRTQELNDAKYYGGETKIARKQARLEEEQAELDRIKKEDASRPNP